MALRVKVVRSYVTANASLSPRTNAWRSDRQDDQHEYHAFGGGTTGQSTANLRQASPHIYSRPEDAGPLAVDDTDYSPAAEDLTVDSPEPERTRAKTVKPSGAFAHPGQRLGSSSGAGGGGQSLGSWLLPEPSPKAASKRRNNGRRRQRPLQSATDNSEDFPRGTRTWGAFAQGQDRSRAGGNSLSTWLEPLPSMATSRKDRRTEPKSGEMLEGAAAEGYESSGGQSDDEYAHNDDDETSNDGVDGNAKWMSDRLEGLDPSGAARYACVSAEHAPPRTPTYSHLYSGLTYTLRAKAGVASLFSVAPRVPCSLFVSSWSSCFCRVHYTIIYTHGALYRRTFTRQNPNPRHWRWHRLPTDGILSEQRIAGRIERGVT